ncbi:nonribosomal peptide synthetase MxcG [Streptomyces sp. 2231.1]|uniref:non-ribosomal peptide synthetase n=1 Tax=Streptomyces sp. 2231.1 TaxID=1855347 RepID=UPI00089789D6|nr:non-ribosomal peptide synthetase [Streptomyces sp. 2231.1]SEE33855.1 nonribosomal peptide synthetase MxcG [Streptomyces sp. 2231.1]
MPTPRHARRHPLLAAQEGIWTGQQLDPDSPAYNTAEYVCIEGPVDVAVFELTLHHVVSETEALNVTYEADGAGRPWQLETPVTDWQSHIVDLTGEPDPRSAAVAWMAVDLARPVDLARGPVFGHALLKTGDEQYLWYHRVHHIALDGFGLSLVARRVAQVYTALMAGEPIPDSGFGTLDSVRAEEQAYRESDRHAGDRAHWNTRYADRPSVASPAGRSALPAHTFHRRVTDLEPDQVDALRTVARELSVTWSEVLLAVTAAHLHRVTGAAEAILSLPVMGRLGSVSLRVPAMVRNILPLRVSVTADDSLRDLAARVSVELRAGLPHQRYRYEQLRRDLKLVGGQRRLSGPGVNIMPFAYDLRFAGHRSTVHNVSAGPVDDLAVNVYDRSDGTGLRIATDANPDLYDETEVAAFHTGLLALLAEAVAAPDRPLSPPSARVLDGGPLPAPARPVLSLIADHATHRGAVAAVEHAGDSITYARLYANARDLALRLTARGAGPDTLVAVALPRGIGAVTAVLGVLFAGAAYCPLDPAAPPDRTTQLLSETEPVLVLTTTTWADTFTGTPVLALDQPDSPPGPAPRPPSPQDPAYVIHTSGSTGRPKGVEISHGALANFVTGATHRYGLRSDDRVLQFAPLHFDASVEEILLTLCAGATLVVRTDDMTESVPRFLDACARLRISVLDLPTAYWHELAHALSTGTAALPAGVRTVVIGGEAALPERVERWRKAVGTSVRLFNTYGPTEATVVATVADLHDPGLAPDAVPIGLPLPGTRAAVVRGELYLLGDNLALGYRGTEVRDTARFVPLAALPGAPRAYRTGDLVDIGDDGQLRFLGRADEEFKISGHRVHPAEVESALLTHPRIREAAVVGRTMPDGARGLAAHLVTDPPTPSASEVRAHLRARLPAAMIPSAVAFHTRLPRTGSGKIDRPALSTAPEPRVPTVGSRLERTVIGVWQGILCVDDIAPDDDVFDLGAQSLQAIQAANRLGTVLARDVRVAWLFQHPTAAALARFLDDRSPAATGLPAALHTDTVLDPDIRPGTGRRTDTPTRILLTGATGFVGAHLLAELLAATDAEIVCTVRAPTGDAAADRVHKALREHRLGLPESARQRITAVPADLARPDLGLAPDLLGELAGTCDAVFHNAATVSILREYGTLRAVNTESTRHLLRLAAQRTIPLHYVSTLSVAPPANLDSEVREEFLPPHAGLRHGYQQSKWASERLLELAAERGLPVTVHRLGRVVGPAGSGYVNADDFLWSVLRAGLPAGILPELSEDETWTPVDHIAKSVVHLARTAAGPVFNHAAVPRVRLSDLYDWVEEYGYAVRRLPLTRWRDQLPPSSGPAATLLAFFDAHDTTGSGTPDLRLGHVRADNVRQGLRGSGITCPPIDRDLVFRYLDHCVTTGKLPAPAGHDPRPASRKQ